MESRITNMPLGTMLGTMQRPKGRACMADPLGTTRPCNENVQRRGQFFLHGRVVPRALG
jgi:hypothetical protein